MKLINSIFKFIEVKLENEVDTLTNKSRWQMMMNGDVILCFHFHHGNLVSNLFATLQLHDQINEHLIPFLEHSAARSISWGKLRKRLKKLQNIAFVCF